jgi:hypothetical protein
LVQIEILITNSYPTYYDVCGRQEIRRSSKEKELTPEILLYWHNPCNCKSGTTSEFTNKEKVSIPYTTRK